MFRVRRAPLTSIKRGQANEPAPGATDMACACKLTKFLMASLMDVCEGEEGGADAVVQRLARPGGGNKKCAVVSIQSGAGLRMLCRQGYYWNQRRAKEPELQPSSPHPLGFAGSTHHPGPSVWKIWNRAGPSNHVSPISKAIASSAFRGCVSPADLVHCQPIFPCETLIASRFSRSRSASVVLVGV